VPLELLNHGEAFIGLTVKHNWLEANLSQEDFKVAF